MISTLWLKELLQHPKIYQLARQFGIWSGAYVVAVSCYLILSGYLEDSTTALSNEKTQITMHTDTLKANRITTERKILEVLKAKAVWEKAKNSPCAGLRIDSLKKILDHLTLKYHLSGNPTIAISAPASVKNLVESATTEIVASSIKLSLSTLDDILAIQFLQEFAATVPGYVTIVSIRLARVGNLDAKIISDITRKVYAPLVTLDVQLLWRDFNDITGRNNANNSK